MISLILLTSASLLAQTATDESAAARVPLEHYLRGHATGDGSHMRKAFLPTAHIEGLRDGKFNSWTLDEYIALYRGTPARDEAIRKRWIEKVEVTGTAAIATVRLDYPNALMTDYMVLLKVDGEWRIANKVVSSQPKPK